MQLSNDAVRNIVARVGMQAQTALTMTDPEALLADLEISRQRGYALDDGEQEIGKVLRGSGPRSAHTDRNIGLGPGSAGDH